MESIILTILPINMEMIKLPSQIKQALGSFCCLIKRILELKQGTENVIIISMTISCTASKVPLPARDNSVAEPKSRLRMLSTKRLAASFWQMEKPFHKRAKGLRYEIQNTEMGGYADDDAAAAKGQCGFRHR